MPPDAPDPNLDPELNAEIDPEILAEFLAEADELLAQLDTDLARLAEMSRAATTADTELLNGIFRALHTLKGSGSFLALDPLTEIAHAAEDALNSFRADPTRLGPADADDLIEAVDVLGHQLGHLRAGGPLPSADAALVERLRDAQADGARLPNPGAAANSAHTDSEPEALELTPGQADLLPFMLDDLARGADTLRSAADRWRDASGRDTLATMLVEETAGLQRTAAFFEIPALTQDAEALATFAEALAASPASDRRTADGAGVEVAATLLEAADLLGHRITDLSAGRCPTESAAALHARLRAGVESETESQTEPRTETQSEIQTDAGSDTAAPSAPAPTDAGPTGSATPSANHAAAPEPTIRVSVPRLEALLNLAGELVLQKNRVLAYGRERQAGDPAGADDVERIGVLASDLDRICGEIQAGVMRVRLQPLEGLFRRYARVLRDLGRSTGKQIELQTDGGDTEVDRTVLENLADPLVHLIRNSADHGIEPPAERMAAGKPAAGCVRLSASREGGHAVIRIADDGRGVDADRVRAKAVAAGLLSEREATALPDADALRYVFAPGLCTRDDVTALSGRGVGMDVVISRIEGLNGMVEIASELGSGTTVTLRIPMTLAIVRAMQVAVSGHVYAIPMENILEIVRRSDHRVSEVDGTRVIRLRDSVIPLLDLARFFGGVPAGPERSATGACVCVVGYGARRLGLIVDAPLGQQEVVIKPLDERLRACDAFSGATITDTGRVSLVLDVGAAIRSASEVAA